MRQQRSYGSRLVTNSVAYHCEEYRCMYFICQRLPDVMVHMGQKHNKIPLHRSFLTLVEEALQQYEQNAPAHRKDCLVRRTGTHWKGVETFYVTAQ